jgi:molybdopterin-containing oxidoreductase family iron-sulfur binding subunit
VVVSLDCDFLLEEPGHVAYSREFIARRRVTEGQKTMNRLYVAESSATITGAMADHRFPMKASAIDSLARALAQAVGVPGVTGETTPENAKWIAAIAADMNANRGNVLVVAGSHQPAAVHALAFAMNSRLGSVGPQSAVSFHRPIAGNTAPNDASLKSLVDEMNAGRVQTVLIMGRERAYNTPADLKFADALNKVPFRAHIGAYEDETSVLCTWHSSRSALLESWGDVRSLDGTVSLIQPLVRPLYEAAKSSVEVLSALLGNDSASGYEAVRANWLRTRGGVDNLAFQKFWQKAVHDGLIPEPRRPRLE